MKASYKGEIYDVASCDFEEKTVLIENENGFSLWVSCKDVRSYQKIKTNIKV